MLFAWAAEWGKPPLESGRQEGLSQSKLYSIVQIERDRQKNVFALCNKIKAVLQNTTYVCIWIAKLNISIKSF